MSSESQSREPSHAPVSKGHVKSMNPAKDSFLKGGSYGKAPAGEVATSATDDKASHADRRSGVDQSAKTAKGRDNHGDETQVTAAEVRKFFLPFKIFCFHSLLFRGIIPR